MIFKRGNLYRNESCSLVIVASETKDKRDYYLSGTVVQCNNGRYYIGEYSNTWKTKHFSSFTGSLEIESSKLNEA
jgi:hypothetical protein